MSSPEVICNLALKHVGSSSPIQSINERSPEAEVCKAFYDTDLRQMFRDFPWPFAFKTAALALVQTYDGTDPTLLYTYAYRYPVDCMGVDRIISYPFSQSSTGAVVAGALVWPLPRLRRDNADSLVKMDFGNDAQGQLIYTDEPSAILRYTALITDPSRYPPDFIKAFSYLLASDIGPTLSKGNSINLSDRAIKNYVSMLTEARARAANEQRPERQPDADTIRARGGWEDGGLWWRT